MNNTFKKNNPILKQVILELKKKVRRNSIKSKIIPKFVFICGKQVFDENNKYKDDEVLKQEKNKRHFLIKEFERQSKDSKYGYNNIFSVISEKLYQEEAIDILTFEEVLAEISDNIIIIVESMGTACELGAFTIKNRYIDKVTVINQKKHANDKSFLNDGPIKKIKDRSNGKNVIIVKNSYYMNKGSKELVYFIEDTVKNEVEIIPNKDQDEISLKYLIYELLNIIEIFGPIEKEDLFELYKYFKGFEYYKIKNKEHHKINTSTQIIELMSRMELIYNTEGLLHISPNVTCYNALFSISREQFERYKLKTVYKPSSKHYIIQLIARENSEIVNNQECN